MLQTRKSFIFMKMVDDKFLKKVSDAPDTELFEIAALTLCNINVPSKKLYSLQVLKAPLLARNPLSSHF